MNTIDSITFPLFLKRENAVVAIFSNLALLWRWLPDAPLVFAKASGCTAVLYLRTSYACDAVNVRPKSGFLNNIEGTADNRPQNYAAVGYSYNKY